MFIYGIEMNFATLYAVRVAAARTYNEHFYKLQIFSVRTKKWWRCHEMMSCLGEQKRVSFSRVNINVTKICTAYMSVKTESAFISQDSVTDFLQPGKAAWWIFKVWIKFLEFVPGLGKDNLDKRISI